MKTSANLTYDALFRDFKKILPIQGPFCNGSFNYYQSSDGSLSVEPGDSNLGTNNVCVCVNTKFIDFVMSRLEHYDLIFFKTYKSSHKRFFPMSDKTLLFFNFPDSFDLDSCIELLSKAINENS